MSTALLIAARDVRDKGRLFLIAAVLACMPFLATVLPASRGHRADVIAVLGGFIGIVFGFGLALTLGLTTFGRELAERRMSFWFSKPISPGALWFGRSLAAIVTAIACFAIISVPSMVAARTAWRMRWTDDQWPVMAAILLAIAVAYFVGHTASTMARSRSALLAIDFVVALIALTLLGVIVRPLLFAPIFRIAIGVAAALLVLVLMIAPYWQLANGRTDIRRSHAALSRALWIGIAIVLAVLGASVLWITSAKPQSFDRIVELEQSPDGKHVIIAGSAPYRRGADSVFVMNQSTGDSTRLSRPLFHTAAFSQNGRYVVWAEPLLVRLTRGTLMVRDLTTSETKSLGIETAPLIDIVLSDDGSRIAVRDGGVIAVYDRATAKLLASMPVDANPRHGFFFVTNDVLRVISHKPTGRNPVPVEIAELDVRTKKLTHTGASQAVPRYNLASVSADGSRMYLRTERLIVDGRTGATIAELPASSDNTFASAMLSDGRVVTQTMANGKAALNIYSRDAVLQHRVALPSRVAWICGERTDGKLILMGISRVKNYDAAEGHTMLLVDLNRGTIDRALNDVKGPMPYWSNNPRLIRYDANAKLAAVDRSGKLTYWN